MPRAVAVVSLGLFLSAGPAAAAEAKFSRAQLEEMIAPIALYPDEVLSTVCIAATYPLEVVEADRWREKNPSLQGDALDKALQQQDWDASVKSLTSFPDVLDRMSNAPGGARSYVKDGKMTGGYALIAWPAEYGRSGIMTFLVNSQGVVFQKDLGAQTAEAVNAMTAYDPNASWTPTR